ncbi:hypothetical protein AOLI_G00187540 [Acnodon oligacanthus]
MLVNGWFCTVQYRAIFLARLLDSRGSGEGHCSIASAERGLKTARHFTSIEELDNESSEKWTSKLKATGKTRVHSVLLPKGFYGLLEVQHEDPGLEQMALKLHHSKLGLQSCASDIYTDLRTYRRL